MSEEINQEFDKRDLNKDGKVTLSEKIEYAAGQAQDKLQDAIEDAKAVFKEAAGVAKEKYAEYKEKAGEK